METNTRHVTTLWLAAAANLLAAIGTFMTSVYYAWMQAMGAQKSVRADLTAYGNLAASAGFLGLFLYLLYCLRRCYKAAPHPNSTHSN